MPDPHILINGSVMKLPMDARVSLLDLLRQHLELHGTKKGCDHGACGAWTVLVDGERILSCLALAIQIDVIWTDIPDPRSPMGAHGIGLIGVTGVGAAVANAVDHATGKRVRSLPITLDKLV